MEGEKSMQMASSISRWSPTKEQISVLEDLYREGLQTPSTEEIQQIASNLRAYGHIEGKNVFYWFQNRKARLRQRQRQEPRLYMSRLVRNRPKVPILPASTTNTTTCPDGNERLLAFSLSFFQLFFFGISYLIMMWFCFHVLGPNLDHSSGWSHYEHGACSFFRTCLVTGKEFVRNSKI